MFSFSKCLQKGTGCESCSQIAVIIYNQLTTRGQLQAASTHIWRTKEEQGRRTYRENKYLWKRRTNGCNEGFKISKCNSETPFWWKSEHMAAADVITSRQLGISMTLHDCTSMRPYSVFQNGKIDCNVGFWSHSPWHSPHSSICVFQEVCDEKSDETGTYLTRLLNVLQLSIILHNFQQNVFFFLKVRILICTVSWVEGISLGQLNTGPWNDFISHPSKI